MVHDRSLLGPVFNRLVIYPLYKKLKISEKIHPNYITLLGLFFSIALIPIYVYRPSGLFFILSACVVLFLICDHLDGLHAKRTQQTSDFGASLDHFCDYVSGIVNIILVHSILHLSLLDLAVFLGLYHCSFYASHLEDLRTNNLYFGTFSPVEGMMSLAVLYLLLGLNAELFLPNSAVNIISYLYCYLVAFGFLINLISVSKRQKSYAKSVFKLLISVILLIVLFNIFEFWLAIALFVSGGLVSMYFLLFRKLPLFQW